MASGSSSRLTGDIFPTRSRCQDYLELAVCLSRLLVTLTVTMTILTSCCRCGKPSRRCCWRTSWGRARTRLGSSSRSWRRSSRSCSWPSSAAPCRSSTSPTPPSPPTPRTAARYVHQRCHNIGHLKHYRLSLCLASKQQSLHEHYIWSTDDDLCRCLHILQQHDQP